MVFFSSPRGPPWPVPLGLCCMVLEPGGWPSWKDPIQPDRSTREAKDSTHS